MINNCIYYCGFASTQKDYTTVAEAMEQRMIEVEDYLVKNEKEGKQFLLGAFTADFQLFNMQCIGLYGRIVRMLFQMRVY